MLVMDLFVAIRSGVAPVEQSLGQKSFGNSPMIA
jgi:hypothetical protein